MIAIFPLLAFLGLALILTRIATVALRITGLSHEVARFQARSSLLASFAGASGSQTVVRLDTRDYASLLHINAGHSRLRAGQAGDVEHDTATAERRRVLESLRERPRRVTTRAETTTTAQERAHRATAGGIE